MNAEICRCEYCEEGEIKERADFWTADLPDYDEKGLPSE